MLQEILEYYSEESFLKVDGHDDAVIGVDESTMKLCYSVGKIIQKLMSRDGMTHEEAVEFFEFNISGAYMGEKNPIYVYDCF